MKQLGFFFDARRCNGCKTCVVACKDAHNLPVGRNFRHVLEVTDGKWSKDPKSGAWKQNVYAYYLSIACNHCSDPACVKACPTGAHHKRTEDGLVVINTDKCIGCGNCAKACPYGAPTRASIALSRAFSRSALRHARSARSNSGILRNSGRSTGTSTRFTRFRSRPRLARIS